MPKTPQGTQHSDEERQGREKLSTLIGERVIHTLGRPRGLHHVQVRPLWEAYYRVNVLVGEDVASLKIANSFFVEADGDGNLRACSPKLTRQH
jgi:hypothetical protein